MRLAGLPMYDLPEVRPATHAWWTGLARAFSAAGIEDVPGSLVEPTDLMAHWRAPDLMFSQTCGLPYTRELLAYARLVATPCYAAGGCDGATYRSLVLTGADAPAPDVAALAAATLAVNSYGSHSGWVALCAAIIGQGQMPACANVVLTGSHRASIAAVARGEADLCAVDCVTFALLQAHVPAEVAGVRSILQSPAAPGLPYITARSTARESLSRLRDGLVAAFEAPDLEAARAALLLRGCDTPNTLLQRSTVSVGSQFLPI